jgi:hypothetical protein
MKRKTIGITLILSILLALMTAGTVFASEENQIELEGIITAIYPDEFKFEVTVDNEGILEIFTVKVGQNFNFDGIELGDLIEVKGTLDADGNVILSELKIKERARDRDQEQEGESHFCSGDGVLHPQVAYMSAAYGVDYSILEGYLCGENPIPIGQIKLAMKIAALLGGDYTDFLDGFEGISWGKLRQDLDLNGKSSHGNPYGQTKKDFRNDGADKKTPPGKLKKKNR